MNASGPIPTPSLDELRRHERGRVLRLVAGLLLIAQSMFVAGFVEVPYIRVQPGSATNVMDLISAEGVQQYPPSGQLLFLTVSLSQRVTPIEAVQSWLDDDVELVKEQVFTGDRSREELTKINLAMMRESQLVAAKVALDHLGYEVDLIGGGALVTDVLPDRPAARRLEVGDIITSVGGEEVTFRRDVIDAVQALEPGDTVSMELQRDGETITVEVATVESDDGVAQVGIELLDNLSFDFPFDVSIDTGRVGGPSAGLAFSLAVLDQLTEGELTGGETVAVTGAIDPMGVVQPVGGVEQKAVAARRAGAVLMLVPAGEADLARPHAGDMRVVAVHDLDDALVALDSLGGNALALPQAPSSDESGSDEAA